MFLYAWTIYTFLAGTYGDLSFLINRQSGIQSVSRNTEEIGILKRGPADHNHGHCDHQCLVDEMLVNVGMAFDHDHCKAFEHVQCSSEVIPNEQLCNNEGKTYPNHCQFIQDSCLLVLDHGNYREGSILHFIYVKHHGACVVPTVPQATSTTHQVLSTTQALQTAATQQLLTQTDGTTTTVTMANQTTAVSSTAAIANQTTTVSTAYILGQAFCAHKNEFICDKSVNVLCASDGKFYPNICELSKAQCDHPTLTEMDVMFCNTQPVG